MFEYFCVCLHKEPFIMLNYALKKDTEYVVKFEKLALTIHACQEN
jgi:hypothetical protein